MCRTVHASYILTCLHAYILVYLHTYVHTYKHTYSKRNARPLGIKGSLACMPPAIASAVFRWRTAGGTTTLWCLRVLLQNITQSPKLNGRRKNHNRIHSKKKQNIVDITNPTCDQCVPWKWLIHWLWITHYSHNVIFLMWKPQQLM
jgi:hypothetical protein